MQAQGAALFLALDKRKAAQVLQRLFYRQMFQRPLPRIARRATAKTSGADKAPKASCRA